MYNSDTELIFPIRVISSLGSLRGPAWRELVKQTSAPKAEELDRIGFVLMMTRLNGCITCNSDSFRAMRGCSQCAFQTIRRFKGSDIPVSAVTQ
jgi:hypothetical protein